MLIKSYHLLMIFFLMLGSIMAISSNSWFTSWLGLEINLMSMIPLILNKINNNYAEAAIKYFISQALASIIIIMMAVCDMYMNANFFFLSNMLMIISLLIKSGMAPFHFWFPQVMIKSSWFNNGILISWQKIAPLIIMTSIINYKMMILVISMSALTGALGGFNQMYTKLIITYSSISHSAWMLPILSVSINYWMIYFSIYCLISISMIFMLSFSNLKKISSFFMSLMSPEWKMFFSLNIMSLGGLPPLMGFLAKLSAITLMMEFLTLVPLMMLIVSSLVSLYFYMKIIYNFMTISNKMMTLKTISIVPLHPQKIILSVSIIFNLITPLMISLT